jgi:hypothetical protein
MVDDCISKGSTLFETMGPTHATKPEKQTEQEATQTRLAVGKEGQGEESE